MRKLRIFEHISLDGVIQAPGGRGEDGDYPYGGWTVPHADPAVGEVIVAAHREAFDLLLGRRTYDIWSGYWPKAGKSPMADSLGAGRRPRTGHRRGRSPHQGEGRAGPDRLGQFDADGGAARIRACR